MFVRNYYQSSVIALFPKRSFCNTVCVCMVMQIKPVVGADVSSSRKKKTQKNLMGGGIPPPPIPPCMSEG